jgi:hypothetical protein
MIRLKWRINAKGWTIFPFGIAKKKSRKVIPAFPPVFNYCWQRKPIQVKVPKENQQEPL